jgi:hypothetical protein
LPADDARFDPGAPVHTLGLAFFAVLGIMLKFHFHEKHLLVGTEHEFRCTFNASQGPVNKFHCAPLTSPGSKGFQKRPSTRGTLVLPFREDFAPDGVIDQTPVRLDPKRLHHAVLVKRDRAGFDLKHPGNLFHGLTLSEQLQDFTLTV